MQTLKLGLVGVGRFGMAHARTIQYSIRGAEIQALCARTPEKVVAAAKDAITSPSTLPMSLSTLRSQATPYTSRKRLRRGFEISS